MRNLEVINNVRDRLTSINGIDLIVDDDRVIINNNNGDTIEFYFEYDKEFDSGEITMYFNKYHNHYFWCGCCNGNVNDINNVIESIFYMVKNLYENEICVVIVESEKRWLTSIIGKKDKYSKMTIKELANEIFPNHKKFRDEMENGVILTFVYFDSSNNLNKEIKE